MVIHLSYVSIHVCVQIWRELAAPAKKKKNNFHFKSVKRATEVTCGGERL